jgi:EAL domain-containing protein (putative c-di-GMP-specific phosphodiesterase class I)
MPRKPVALTLMSLSALSVDRSPNFVKRILSAARNHLDMEVAFLAELVEGREIVQAIDGDGGSFGLEKIEDVPVVSVYCRRLVEGRLPSIVGDAGSDPALSQLEVTAIAGVGSWIGVPVKFSDGVVFGALCCMSHLPDPSLSETDVGFMRVLARLIGDDLERQHITSEKHRLELERIRYALAEGTVSMVFQPIVDLRDGATVGVEALARFGGEPEHSPITWFEEAESVGLRTELELVAVRAALAQLSRIPPPLYLSVNVSPNTILSPQFLELLAKGSPDRVVVEITEHAPVDDYGSLKSTLRLVHELGARVAIDDTGAGFASLAHIYRLEPDVIKLDISLTHGIDRDPIRQCLASSLVDFAKGIDAAMTGEGIETRAEGETLCSLGVGFGQGWYLAKPAPLEEVTGAIPSPAEGNPSPALAG